MFERRNFIKGALGISAVSILPSVAFQLISVRSAIGVAPAAIIAIVGAAMQVASALLSLRKGSSGLGLRLQALQMSVDAILDLQTKTLEAIGVLNGNLDGLKQFIPELFRQDAFRRSLEETQKAYDETRSLAKQVLPIAPIRLTTRDFERVIDAHRETQHAISQLSTNVGEEIKGVPGIAAMAFASSTCRMLCESLWLIAKLEKRFPIKTKPPTWSPAVAIGDLSDKLQVEIIPGLQNKLINELLKEQTEERKNAWDSITKNPWGPKFVSAFAAGKPEVSFEACLRSKYQNRKEQSGNYCRWVGRGEYTQYVCTPLYATYSLASFERRVFKLQFQVNETTKERYVTAIALEKSTPGWHVPADQRRTLGSAPHAAGESNVPTAGIGECSEIDNYSTLDSDQTTVFSALQRHAQAQLYIACLTDIRLGLGDLTEALQLLRERELKLSSRNKRV